MNNRTMPSKNNRAGNVVLIMLCLSFQTMSLAGTALFLPVIRSELGLSFTQGGSLSAAATFVYALMQIPAGYLADRYGLKKMFLVGALGTTIQAVSGFFKAFLFVSGITLLANWFGPQRRATAMGLSLIGVFSGQFFISTLGPSLVRHFDWRFPFISFGIVGILASLAYLWLAKESPHAESRQKPSIVDVLQLFRYRFMWVCGVIQYVRLGVVQGILFWLPSLLIDEKGLSLQTTGLIIALQTLVIAPSNIIGGYMSDRLKKPTLIIGLSLFILAMTTASLVRIDNIAALITVIFINAVFVQFYFGPLFAVPVERYGSHMMGTLSGFSNFFANLGGFTFTYLLGVLKDRTGFFESGFYAVSVACLLGLMFTILLEKMRHYGVHPEN
jgi:MFS family permease